MTVPTTVAELTASHPDLVAQIRNEAVAGMSTSEAALAAARAEGATAERTRLAGIESAALPGHDALIAQCKADPTCTPGDAALRVNTAEREKIKAHGASIANVEQVTGAVGAAVTTQPDAGTVTFPQTVDGWKAEYAANAKLQSEHVSADAYANWKQGVADGRVRIFTGNRR